jgi:hypothetical protein
MVLTDEEIKFSLSITISSKLQAKRVNGKIPMDAMGAKLHSQMHRLTQTS